MSDLAVDVAMKLTILFITIALSVGLFKVLQKNISFLRVVHQGYQVQLDGVYTKVYAFKIMTVLLSGVFQLVFFFSLLCDMLLIWTFSPNCIMLPCCICRFSACSSLLGQCISIKKNPTSNENQF